MQPRRTSSFGREVVHLRTFKYDRTFSDLAPFGMQQVGNCLQCRGFAGAVGAEQRDDPAFRHVERDTFEHENNVVVDDLDIVD